MAGNDYLINEVAVRALTVVAGIGVAVGGCFTASRLVDILQTIPLTNISFEAQHGLNLIDADVIIYTQVSAGLVIALGILCLLFVVPIILRICKINIDSVNCRKIILLVDIVLILFYMVGYGIGGVIGFLGVEYWSTSHDVSTNQHDQFIPLATSTVALMRDTLSGTATAAIFASGFFIILLCVWIIFGVMKHKKMRKKPSTEVDCRCITCSV